MSNPKPCPQCGKPAVWENNPHHPFCCERCKLIDLGNWATGSYRIPDRAATEDDLENEYAEPDDDESEESDEMERAIH